MEGVANADAQDGAWQALVAETDWNGWVVPYFDPETAEKLVAALDAAPGLRARGGAQPSSKRCNFTVQAWTL